MACYNMIMEIAQKSKKYKSEKYLVYSIVNAIKGYSSHILREGFPELKRKLPTLWTHSKFISSVDSVSLKNI
jgi:REP element-mobilizing transposase RayT